MKILFAQQIYKKIPLLKKIDYQPNTKKMKYLLDR